MKRTAVLTLISFLLCWDPSFAQQRGGQPPPPATDTVAPAIPGVVAGGTKVQVIKEGFQGTEGPIAHPDGSLLFTETNANRITKIDKDNNVSTFLENTNGSNGLAFDSKGRLISVQTTPGQDEDRRDLSEGIGSGSHRQLRRQTVRAPERSRRRQEGRRLLHRPGPERAAWRGAVRAAAAASGLLRAPWRTRDKGRRRHRAAERHSIEPRREDAVRQQHQRRVPARVRHPGRTAR